MRFRFNRDNGEMPLNKKLKDPTTDQFSYAYNTMRTWHEVPETGVPKLDVHVHTTAFDWVQRTAIGAGVHPGIIWEAAIQMAGFNLLAAEVGMEPYLVAPRVSDGNGGLVRGERHNLPPLPVWTSDDCYHQFIGLQPQPPQFNVAKRYLGVEDPEIRAETLVDNGVRILGGLALMPAGSALAVRDSRDKQFGIRPPFPVAGADAYPADLSFSLPPRTS